MKTFASIIIFFLLSVSNSDLCNHSPPPVPLTIADLNPIVSWEPFNGNLITISFTHSTVQSIANTKCNYAIKFYQLSWAETYGKPFDYTKEYSKSFNFSGTNTCTLTFNLTGRLFDLKKEFWYQIFKLDRYFLSRRMAKRLLKSILW